MTTNEFEELVEPIINLRASQARKPLIFCVALTEPVRISFISRFFHQLSQETAFLLFSLHTKNCQNVFL